MPDSPDAFVPIQGEVVRVKRGCHPYYKANARCLLIRKDGHGDWWGAFSGLGNPGDMFLTSINGYPPDEWNVGSDANLQPV